MTILNIKGYDVLIDEEDLSRILEFSNKWYINKRDNTVICFKKVNNKWTSIYLHRFILNIHYLRHPNIIPHVDHINHNTLDNRKENLRTCSISQNNCNQRISKKNSTGIKGVCWYKRDKKYQVRINIFGKVVYGGRFFNLEDAKKKVEELRNLYHKEFSCNN